MKKPLAAILVSCLYLCTPCWAQVALTIRIESGSSTSTCTDLPIFGNPEPFWAVNIENEGWDTYPAQGFCPNFYDPPRTQYTADYACYTEVPDSVQLCLNAFENDAILPCFINEECNETRCQRFAVPAIGTSQAFTYALPAGLSSEATINFTIATTATTPATVNDLICDAIDLGVLPFDGTLGNALLSQYSNVCATAATDPDPGPYGGWTNEQGVWFTFMTGAQTSAVNTFLVNSDPEVLGDPMDTQIAIFKSTSGTCNGPFTFEDWYGLVDSTVNGMLQPCLEPNTRYYVLIDGEATDQQTVEGFFGLSITAHGIAASPNLICDALFLGTVPTGGSLTTGMTQANHCSDGIGDGVNVGFQVQNGVWFSFRAPASGHINVEVRSDALYPMGIDPIDVQIALFRTFNDLCTGGRTRLAFADNGFYPVESITLSCLTPDKLYWLLVDGSGNNNLPGSDAVGVFSVSVYDGGVLPPEDTTAISPVICDGASFSLGDSTYTQTGLIYEIFKNSRGCDSLVTGMLTVLPPLTLQFDTLAFASMLGAADGSLEVTPFGGSPTTYEYLWDNGQTTPAATGLVGGQQACVTVTDEIGCTATGCLEVPYVFEIVATLTPDTLACFGDTNAVATLLVTMGQPPYTYTWVNTAQPSRSGNGTIPANNLPIVFPHLAGGSYQLTITNAFTEKVINFVIEQPAVLTAGIAVVAPIVCYGDCTATLRAAATGGVGSYTYVWSGGSTPTDVQTTDLCAGNYTVLITDANGCTFLKDTTVAQPPPLMGNLTKLKEVTCHGGSDGQVFVSANVPLAAYMWDNGEATATAMQLSAGAHTVTITDINGCMDTLSTQLTEPLLPVLTATVVQPISCFDTQDGSVQVAAQHLQSPLQYAWSNGGTAQTLTNLGEETYTVTVTDANLCTATTAIALTAPLPITTRYTAKNLSCFDGGLQGSVRIDSVSGGSGNYQYSFSGAVDTAFSTLPIYGNLEAGTYTLRVKDARGCVATYPIAIQDPTGLFVTAGEDRIINLGETAEIDALALQTDITYSWQSSLTPLSCYDCRTVTVAPLYTDIYVVTIRDSVTGCVARDTLLLQVARKDDIFIPTGFTPNGDGFNDVLTIFGGKSVAQIEYFAVYNRWGNLLYTAKNFQPNSEEVGWKGVFEDKAAPAGVYVYVVQVAYIDGRRKEFKGDVTLLR